MKLLEGCQLRTYPFQAVVVSFTILAGLCEVTRCVLRILSSSSEYTYLHNGEGGGGVRVRRGVGGGGRGAVLKDCATLHFNTHALSSFFQCVFVCWLFLFSCCSLFVSLFVCLYFSSSLSFFLLIISSFFSLFFISFHFDVAVVFLLYFRSFLPCRLFVYVRRIIICG